MSREYYVGQYLINNVDQGGYCEQDVGECVWQDSKSLLCVHYESCTSGKMFHSILLVPVRLAKKIKWYATFDEFYEAISVHSNCRLEMTMTSKERKRVQSIKKLPAQNSNNPWSSDFHQAGNCVARLARCLSERPAAGKFLADFLAEYIAAETAKHEARKATIEAIAKMIADARLSHDDRLRLGLATQIDDDIPF